MSRDRDQRGLIEFDVKIGPWEFEKISYIFRAVRERFGIDLWVHGTQVGVNPNSGCSWVWNEDYPVSWYMPINCELRHEDVYALWSNPENGDEHECEISAFNSADDIWEWVDELSKEDSDGN
jgi:hypothetical protein